jgi:DNA-binding IclR family transcriptional regulator
VIQSVDRAARILNALAASSGRLGVSDLSARLELAKGTVHGLLKTLRDQGLVEQDPESDKYQLGPALLKLSNRFLYLNELRSRSQAWSESLAARTHEAVRVGMPHDGGILIVHHVFRPDASLQILEVGAVLPLHATALGKAVLAHLGDAAEREALKGELPKLTGRTLGARALRTELAEVRSRRYALEREEAVLGEASVASPIFSRRGTVVGAIGVVGPPERVLDGDGGSALAAPVIEVARAISRELGAP